MLKFEDYVLLSHADLSLGKIDYGDRAINIDPTSMERLEAAKLCDRKGVLTSSGKTTAEALQKKIAKLQKGVDYSLRKRTDHHKVEESLTWRTGIYKKKRYVCDGNMMLFTTPYAGMNAVKGSAELRHTMASTIQKVGALKKTVELTPKIWQVQSLGGLETIGLQDSKGKTTVLIQGMYHDYTMRRLPSARYFGLEGRSNTPIQVKVRNKGFVNDLAGIVMPLLQTKGETVIDIGELK